MAPELHAAACQPAGSDGAPAGSGENMPAVRLTSTLHLCNSVSLGTPEDVRGASIRLRRYTVAGDSERGVDSRAIMSVVLKSGTRLILAASDIRCDVNCDLRPGVVLGDCRACKELREWALAFDKCGADWTSVNKLDMPLDADERKALRALLEQTTNSEAEFNERWRLRLGRVEKLDAPRSLKRLPDQIGQLSALKTLKLYYCSKLSTLPAAIGHLHELKLLDLGHCGNLVSLPNEFRALKSLTDLSLRWCLKLTLSPVIGELGALRRLNMFQCSQLTELPREIGGLGELIRLDLRSCSGLRELPAEIGQLSSLEYIDLTGCTKLKTLPRSVCQLGSLETMLLSNSQDAPGASKTSARAPGRWSVSGEPVVLMDGQLDLTEALRRLEQPSHPLGALGKGEHAKTLISFLFCQEHHGDGGLAERLREHPDVCRAFLSHGINNVALVQLLNELRPDELQEIGELKDDAGTRAIEIAHHDVQEKMESALYFLGRFELDDGHPLHLSKSSAVVAATEHRSKSTNRRVALKAIRQAEEVLAELNMREGLTGQAVVNVLEVIVDKEERRRFNCMQVKSYDGLQEKIQAALERQQSRPLSRAAKENWQRAGNMVRADSPSRSDSADSELATPIGEYWSRSAAASAEGYKYVLVLELADRTLFQALAHDRIAGHDGSVPFQLHIALAVAKALDSISMRKRIHGDLNPHNIVRVHDSKGAERWQLIDLDVACECGKP